jgi:hypothetical protein
LYSDPTFKARQGKTKRTTSYYNPTWGQEPRERAWRPATIETVACTLTLERCKDEQERKVGRGKYCRLLGQGGSGASYLLVHEDNLQFPRFEKDLNVPQD